MNRKVHYKKTHLLRAAFALLTMLLTAAPVAWVQQSATVNISTNNEWNEFVKDFNQDGVYDNITTVTVNITGDIVSSAMLGTSNRKFSGTINGNGHTFTFKKGNLSTYFNEQYAALFRYVNNVTIRDLHIDGEIYTSSKYAAAFIGSASGTNSIINCCSSVVIESSVNGDGTHAGFVATVASSASNTLIIEGCVFDGKLRGTNTHSCGGFIGWRGGSAIVRRFPSLPPTSSSAAESPSTIHGIPSPSTNPSPTPAATSASFSTTTPVWLTPMSRSVISTPRAAASSSEATQTIPTQSTESTYLAARWT